MFKKTQGYFDPSLGQLTRSTYGFGQKKEEVPSQKELKRALRKVGGNNIEQLPNQWVRLKNNILLDFGGIGKGYAVDLVVNELTRLGVRRGQVSASGDIRCLSDCNIQVVDPFQPDQVMLLMKGLPAGSSISTSGTYERYIQSKKNHHLLEPKTGQPSQSFVSVTLVGSISNAELDAWATALSVMPVREALSRVEKQEGFAALFVFPDKTKKISARFLMFVKEMVWKNKD